MWVALGPGLLGLGLKRALLEGAGFSSQVPMFPDVQRFNQIAILVPIPWHIAIEALNPSWSGIYYF